MSRVDAKAWLAKLANHQRGIEALIEQLRTLANETVRPEMEGFCNDLADEVNEIRLQIHGLMGELRKGTQ